MAEALKQDWEVGPGGGNMVRNTVTGQVADIYNPAYTNYKSGTGNGVPGTGGLEPVPPGTGSTMGTAGQTQSGQAAAASYYSPTPTAAPTANTANQGGQDVLRNALMAQMADNPANVTVNDPAIKAQLDPANAAIERAQRDEVRRGSEEAFGGQQAYGYPERMAAAERAGQQSGLLASDLVGKEITSRRAMASDAMSKFGGLLSGDQARALQKYQVDLDAQLRREGLSQTGSLGSQDLALRDKLGMGGLNIDMIRTLLQNQQFGDSLGLDAGYKSALLNNSALTHLM